MTSHVLSVRTDKSLTRPSSLQGQVGDQRGDFRQAATTGLFENLADLGPDRVDRDAARFGNFIGGFPFGDMPGDIRLRAGQIKSERNSSTEGCACRSIGLSTRSA